MANNSTNDEKTIQSIILEHFKTLRRFAYSLTNDVHDADDLVQKVIEKLLKNPVPNKAEPLPWIFRVCRNAWIDELRSRNIRTVDHEVTIESVADSSESNNVLSEMHQRDLQKAIEALPESYRVVISLVIVAGLSYAETAESLDIPIGTVMSRIARARKKLIEILDDS